MGYEVVSLDAQNRPDLQLNQLEDVIELQARRDHHERGRFRCHRARASRRRSAAGIPVLNYDRQIRATEFELTSVAGTVEIGQIAAGEAIRLLTERHGAPTGQGAADPGRSRRQLHPRHPEGLRGAHGRRGARRRDRHQRGDAVGGRERRHDPRGPAPGQPRHRPDLRARRASDRAAGRDPRGRGQAARRDHDDGLERRPGRPRQHPLAAGSRSRSSSRSTPRSTASRCSRR